MELVGFNATMPHKLELIPLMDKLTPAAMAPWRGQHGPAGERQFIGHNTDGDGFASSLQDFGMGSRQRMSWSGRRRRSLCHRPKGG